MVGGESSNETPIGKRLSNVLCILRLRYLLDDVHDIDIFNLCI